MPEIGLIPAELAALVLETLLTGVSFVLYAAAFYVLLYKKGLSSKASATPFNMVLFVITVLLLCAGFVVRFLIFLFNMKRTQRVF